MILYPTKKVLYSERNYQQNKKATSTGGRRYSQTMYLIRGHYPKYTKNSIQLSTKKTIQLENWQVDIFPKTPTDGQQAHEKMLNTANYREMQIKTAVKNYLTLVRMVIIKKSTNNKC